MDFGREVPNNLAGLACSAPLRCAHRARTRTTGHDAMPDQNSALITFESIDRACERLDVGRSKYYGWVRDGLAPPPVKFGVRDSRTLMHETAALVGAIVGGATAEQIRSLVLHLLEMRVTAFGEMPRACTG